MNCARSPTSSNASRSAHPNPAWPDACACSIFRRGSKSSPGARRLRMTHRCRSAATRNMPARSPISKSRFGFVSPPMLTTLVRNELRPAYIYHRPPVDGGIAALKGLRQSITDQAVSLSGAVSQFSVPAGTDIELFGTLDKELVDAVLIPVTRKGEPAALPFSIKLTDDHKGFRHEFADVQSAR